MKRNRKNNRLEDYDYSQDGYYFVTICTRDRAECFGEIRDNKMILSKIGEIVDQCWQEIPRHFPDVELDEYAIMPNHVHGIIIIENGNDVENADLRSLQNYDRTKMALSKIIHGFKSSVTRQINKQSNKINFVWQKSFYDHVIRNERSLHQIREYIVHNFLKWESDRNNPENLFM